MQARCWNSVGNKITIFTTTDLERKLNRRCSQSKFLNYNTLKQNRIFGTILYVHKQFENFIIMYS